MENRKLAEFILGMVDMGVASELPEEEHLEMIITSCSNKVFCTRQLNVLSINVSANCFKIYWII